MEAEGKRVIYVLNENAFRLLLWQTLCDLRSSKEIKVSFSLPFSKCCYSCVLSDFLLSNGTWLIHILRLTNQFIPKSFDLFCPYITNLFNNRISMADRWWNNDELLRLTRKRKRLTRRQRLRTFQGQESRYQFSRKSVMKDSSWIFTECLAS